MSQDLSGGGRRAQRDTGVIVGTIWVSAASLFPSLLPGVLWPVACVRFALCPLEHTTIPTDSYGPLHTLVLASTNTTSTTVLVVCG